jgi:hypothetical protein
MRVLPQNELKRISDKELKFSMLIQFSFISFLGQDLAFGSHFMVNVHSVLAGKERNSKRKLDSECSHKSTHYKFLVSSIFVIMGGFINASIYAVTACWILSLINFFLLSCSD